MRTHMEIEDKSLRAILANELLVLRRSMLQTGTPMTDTFAYGVRTGLDTFARRMQDVSNLGVRAVYWQNFEK
jgi:hypothetical protein